MVKRLKYTKEILTHIHAANQNKDGDHKIDIKADVKFSTLTGFSTGMTIKSGK